MPGNSKRYVRVGVTVYAFQLTHTQAAAGSVLRLPPRYERQKFRLVMCLCG